jgi:isopenicillin N synthase-like dioxygenase
MINKDCYEVEKNILRALAVGFRIAEDYFLQMHTKPDNQLRLAHYPRFVFVFGDRIMVY